jgi:hypothetical protein
MGLTGQRTSSQARYNMLSGGQCNTFSTVGLTVIWQLKGRAAGTEPGELAAAEAWNPAVVARSVIAAARHRLEIHRAQRREAERAQAAPVTPQFAGDDGLVHPDQS